MLYTHKINFDLSKLETRKRITVVYGSRDSVAVELSLYDRQTPWMLPEGTSCIIRFMKANGNGGVYHTLSDGTKAWNVEENRVTVLLAPEALDVPGLLDVSVVTVNGGRTLGIYGFDIHVECNCVMPLSETDDLLEFKNLSDINTGFALLQLKTEVDTGLSVPGRPADAAAVGAAVKGYGLGVLGATMPALLDLNSATKIGWYYVNTDSANNPIGFGGVLRVESSSANNLLQTLVSSTVSTKYGVKLQRVRLQGEWQEWEWIDPPMITGTEYRTTERYQGKAVYVKVLDCGTLPNADNKTVVYSGKAANAISVVLRLSSGRVIMGGYGKDRSVSTTQGIYVSTTDFNVSITTEGDFTSLTAHAIVKYTKD